MGYIFVHYVFGANIIISIVFRCENSYLILLILYNVFNCIKYQLIVLLDLQCIILLLLCSPYYILFLLFFVYFVAGYIF
jgi:hypothetical protein